MVVTSTSAKQRHKPRCASIVFAMLATAAGSGSNEASPGHAGSPSPSSTLVHAANDREMDSKLRRKGNSKHTLMTKASALKRHNVLM